ncbi:MAG TPA: hypothetical protein VFJ19_20060 [Nocardioidaceae bacterium]|nr:hypothetical protein [Nocardioidaceae bacterium]
MLHLSLVLRLWVGDSLGVELARQVGGVGNIAALLLFVVAAVWCAGGSAAKIGRRER